MRRAPLICLVFLALAGCTNGHVPENGQFVGQSVPPALSVSETRRETVLKLDGPGATFGSSQRAALTQFIVSLPVDDRSAVHLDLAGPQPAVLAARATAIEAGVEPSKIAWVAPAQVNAVPHVHVVGSVWKVNYPKCPRESTYVIVGSDNIGSSNYGCSTVSDLEAMVADPRDLVRGESGGETDSVLTSAAIDRLHQDKLKKIDTTVLKVSGGGS